MSNRGTTIHLKTKKLKSGKLSYYLHIYHPLTRKRHKEYLGLYLHLKPKNQFDRNHNQETKKLAESIHAKRLLEIQNGNHGFKPKEKRIVTLLSYYESLSEKKKDSSQTSYSNWISSLKHLRKFTRIDLKLTEIDFNFLNGYKEFLLNEKLTKSNTKLSQNSASTYFNKLVATMNEAFNNGLIEHNPVQRVKKIRPAEVVREFLTEEEIQKLFDTPCKATRIKNSFLFGVLTGLRFSDIEHLQWKDVQHSDDHGWFIRFRQQKTKGIETLHINEQARALLGEKTEDDRRVFEGLKYSAHNNHLLLNWNRDAGINKHITFHTSRHTHACLLLSKGVDIYTVSKILGHREVKTTQIYAKVIDQNKIKAIGMIPDF